LIRRERLFAALDQKLERKVLWISGPGGAGKTSLVSSFIEARGRECLWYQVDASDADLASFTQYLALGVAERPGEALPAFIAAHLFELGAFARRFFEAFFARLDEPIVLVFDNYQEMPADAHFHEFFVALLDHASAQTQVIVLSRAEPPGALTKWSLDPQFSALDWREMQFSAEETAALARNWGVERSEDVAALVHASRGWAAGMVMMLRAAQRGVDLKHAHAALPRQLFNYFASQVWSRIPAATQSFLYSTAFLPYTTAALARTLTGNPQAARILADLHEDNFFTDRRSGEPSVYEYHPLFREFLAVRAAEALGSEALAELQRRAATLLEEGGQVVSAADLLIAAKDWHGLGAFIERHAEAMVDQAKVHTLRAWLDALPDVHIARVAWLLLWQGLCQVAARDGTFRASLKRACELFDAAGDLIGSCAARGWLLQTATPGDDIGALLTEVQAQLERHGPIDDPALEARIIRNFHPDFRFPARHPLWTAWVDRAAQLARKLPEPGQRLRMAAYAGIAYFYCGEIMKVRSVVGGTQADLELRGVSDRDRLIFLVAQCSESFYSGGFDLAEQALKAFERDAAEGPLDQTIVTRFKLRLALVSGDTSAAAKWEEWLNQTPTLVSRDRANVLRYIALARLACGDLGEAWSKARELSAILPPRSVGFAVGETLQGLILLARGDNEAARAKLDEAAEIAREHNGPFMLFPALQLLAVAEHRLRRRDEALAHLREGMRLARGERCVLSFVLPTRELLLEIVELALAHGIEVEHAREMIVRLKLRPRSPESDNWPWPLRITTLGTFAVQLERTNAGADWGAGKKKPRKPLELLQFLIAHGGGPIAVSAVIDALWPDAEGDAGAHSFEVTLYRLRKLLGLDEAIALEGGKLALNRAVCWVDCFALEQLAATLAEANDAAANGERFEALAQRALDLYRGHFLAGDETPAWARAYREKLRFEALRLTEHLGKHLEAAAHAPAAEQLYRRALQLDPVAEPIHRQLIRLLAARGEKAAAIEAYRRCREMLSMVLNVKPAAETERLYESIRQMS
jgi:ATP/maltotriose-dependent transcriptional regulator MalT/DNA-binding SARP family transcriptional activator